MKRCRVIRKRWKKKSHGYNASAREQFNPGSARLTRLANKFQIPAPSPLPISLDPSNLHLYSMQQSSSSHTDLLEEKGKKERKKEEKKKGGKFGKNFHSDSIEIWRETRRRGVAAVLLVALNMAAALSPLPFSAVHTRVKRTGTHRTRSHEGLPR